MPASPDNMPDLADILPETVRLAAEMAGAEGGALGLLEPDGQSITFKHTHNFDLAAAMPPVVRGQGLAWQVIDSGQPLPLADYSAQPNALPGWVQAGVRSCVVAPVVVDGERLGVLALFNFTDGKPLSDHATRLAVSAGLQAGAAVHNARLYAELSQRTAELEALAGVSAAMRAATNSAAMPPIILDQILAVLRADSAALLLREAESGDMLVALGRGRWEVVSGQRLAAGQGVIGQMMESGQPYVQSGEAEASNPLLPGASALAGGVACIPLIAHGTGLGAICAARPGDGEQAFSPAEIRLLAAIGDLASNAIQRARLHEQTRKRLEWLTALREIDMTISSSLELELTLDVLLEHVTRQLGVHAADVLLLKPGADTLDYAAARGFRTEALRHTRLPLGAGNAGRAALQQRMLHIPDIGAAGGEFSRAPLLAQEGFVAYYALPLVAKGHVRGVLEVFHREPLHTDGEWLEFMQSLAAQAAIALDNAVLFEDLQASLEAQRAAQAQLVRVARLTAVGELAAGVAHQINNPLTTIIADSQLLVRSLDKEHPGHASASAIHHAGWRAQRVVQRLLNFSRPEESEIAATDVNNTIVAALDLVSAHVERGGVDLNVDLATDLPPIPGSERQLEEVWINLLMNAKDALTGERTGEISIISRLAEDGQAVEVAVADNGKGIDESERPKIFTPFFTTKEPGRGNGLGLSVCQSIVQNHHGTIGFDSQAGRGTTFLIRLPRMT